MGTTLKVFSHKCKWSHAQRAQSPMMNIAYNGTIIIIIIIITLYDLTVIIDADYGNNTIKLNYLNYASCESLPV